MAIVLVVTGLMDRFHASTNGSLISRWLLGAMRTRLMPQLLLPPSLLRDRRAFALNFPRNFPLVRELPRASLSSRQPLPRHDRLLPSSSCVDCFLRTALYLNAKGLKRQNVPWAVIRNRYRSMCACCFASSSLTPVQTTRKHNSAQPPEPRDHGEEGEPGER
eukprot:763722-Hanusia_phi.AAC.2